VFSKHFATQRPITNGFRVEPKRSEVRIEKTIAYVLSERLRHFVCNDKMCNSHCEVSMQSLT